MRIALHMARNRLLARGTAGIRCRRLAAIRPSLGLARSARRQVRIAGICPCLLGPTLTYSSLLGLTLTGSSRLAGRHAEPLSCGFHSARAAWPLLPTLAYSYLLLPTLTYSYLLGLTRTYSYLPCPRRAPEFRWAPQAASSANEERSSTGTGRWGRSHATTGCSCRRGPSVSTWRT